MSRLQQLLISWKRGLVSLLWLVLYFGVPFQWARQRLLLTKVRTVGSNVSFDWRFRTYGGKSIHVGNNVNLVDAFCDAHAEISIEDNVFFGHQVMLLTAKHDITQFDANRQQAKQATPIRICRGAWLASRVIVLGGVTIGEGAVVAAGALVTRDVPPLTVVGGVPAKALKSLRLVECGDE